MTDILKGCTVAFDRDIREDDAEAVLNAIRMIKGVLSVSPSLSEPGDWAAGERLRRELGDKLWAVIYPKDK